MEDGQGLDDELAVVEGMQFDRKLPLPLASWNKPGNRLVELDGPLHPAGGQSLLIREMPVLEGWPGRANR